MGMYLRLSGARRDGGAHLHLLLCSSSYMCSILRTEEVQDIPLCHDLPIAAATQETIKFGACKKRKILQEQGHADAVRGKGKGEAGDLGTLDQGSHN